MGELYYVLRAYGAGWDAYGFAHTLERAQERATRLGWVVLAADRETARSRLYYHIKNADFMDKNKGNGRTIWRGVTSDL